MRKEFSAVITKGEIAYVALCPELGIVSQGRTEKSALKNLREATELYLEDEDVQRQLAEQPVRKAKVYSMAVSA